jgi:hypothetical protein
VGEILGPIQYNEKQKLTLGLPRKVIERAKAAGINISAVTEQMLRALTYEPAGFSNDDIAEAYDKLFKSMLPVLGKYGANVTVGEHRSYLIMDESPLPCDILLDKTGELWIDADIIEQYPSISIADALTYLYDPLKILEELISSLIRAAENNKNRLETFRFASRFLKMLSEDEPTIEK